jgi:hypothetical protein
LDLNKIWKKKREDEYRVDNKIYRPLIHNRQQKETANIVCIEYTFIYIIIIYCICTICKMGIIGT